MALLTVVAVKGGWGLDGGGKQKPVALHAYLVWSWDVEFLGCTPPKIFTAGTWRTPWNEKELLSSINLPFFGFHVDFQGCICFFSPTKWFNIDSRVAELLDFFVWTTLWFADLRGLLILKFGFGIGATFRSTWLKNHLSSVKTTLVGCFIWRIILPSYIGIIISHYQDPH